MSILASRKDETEILRSVLSNKQAQFIAIYGRRRVGKTFLIKTYFSDKGIYFEVTGLKEGNTNKQLQIFAKAFSKCFNNDIRIAIPESWDDAFELLTTKIQEFHKRKPVVIFFDELPWLATRKSGFMGTLDHYWNTEWKNIKNLKLIVCGSAASWMLEKVINDKGGLHNRLTQIMLLKPFNLKQTKEFLVKKNMQVSNKAVLDIYMVTGGIPYYLELLQRSKSVVQNINQLCFTRGAPLSEEFEKIFRSLFNKHNVHISLIKAIASKHYGVSRDELIDITRIPSGGNLNDRLNELQAAGFIQSYTPYQGGKTDLYYRVIDEYSIFYLKWIEPLKSTGFEFQENYWQKMLHTPSWNAWAGYAFEAVCMKHSQQIQKALQLERIVGTPVSWRYAPKKGSKKMGAQIDILFDRDEDAITICEIRYSSKQYRLDKSSAKNIDNKVDRFKEITKTNKQVFVALVTTLGVSRSLWLEDVIDQVVTLDDLIE